jgi:hypothetical protein
VFCFHGKIQIWGVSNRVLRKSGNKGEKIQKSGENGVMRSFITLIVYHNFWIDQMKEDEQVVGMALP